MTPFDEKARPCARGPLPRLVPALALTLAPAFASAAEGEHIRLRFDSEVLPFLWAAIGLSLAALVYAALLIQRLLKEPAGPESMQEVGRAIKDGALAYLRKQIGAMVLFGGVLFLGLAALYWTSGPVAAIGVAVSFALGALGSYVAGYTGMVMAVNGNMRVAFAATNSYRKALEVAFRSGSVAGLVTVGIGLLGAAIILLVGGESAVRYLVGFGFGGSLAALFMRVGGGIFTKAADVGADLVGKVEQGIPEDDPRNPAVIADNVGDNVGDCAGMAADVFESYEVTLISAIVLAAATSALFDREVWMRLVAFSLLVAGIGTLASIIGITLVKGSDDPEADPLVPIRRGFNATAFIGLVLSSIAALFLLTPSGSLQDKLRGGFATSQLQTIEGAQSQEARLIRNERSRLARATVSPEQIQAAVARKAEQLKRQANTITVFDLYNPPDSVPKELNEVPQAVAGQALLRLQVRQAREEKAKELKKPADQVTADDLLKDPTKVPASIATINRDTLLAVIEDRLPPVEPYQIGAADLVRSPSLVVRGYKPEDVQRLEQIIQAPEPTSTPASVEGFQRVTDPNDSGVPALTFATTAPVNPTGAPPTTPYSTVGKTYLGNGKDQLVVKELHIKAELPAQPSVQGQPAQPPQKIDQRQWIGPVRLGTIEDQIKQQRDLIAQRKLKATVEDLRTLPVPLYVGPGNQLALGIPSEVTNPQSLRYNGTYFDRPLKEFEDLQKINASGIFSSPPSKNIQLLVTRSNVVPWWKFVLAFAIGLALALGIEKLTEYYVSTHRKPTREVAGVSSGGPAPMIIQGFAYASESSAMMVVTLIVALLCPLALFPPALYGGYELALFGIALVGLGLLSTTGYVLAMDTFGPISDNAQGVYEMSGEGSRNERGARAVSLLDAAGNTTKALTKGFAIATAVVAAIALFNSYRAEAMLTQVGLKLDVPEIFLGLLIGGAAPFLFAAFAMSAVGRASFELIGEVRRQFAENPGIMTRETKPDYARCVAIVTAAAQKELLGPGILAIALPIAVGFGFSIGKAPVQIGDAYYNLTGAQALGGFLAGAILSGQLLAVLLANSGGMWDNAKKLIEDGHFGGKNSENHKASVVCDTVGDPFKDTAGPALNPLIKVMNLVALLIAGVVILPLPDGVLVAITVVSVAALAFAVWRSKQGSIADQMNQMAAAPDVV